MPERLRDDKRFAVPNTKFWTCEVKVIMAVSSVGIKYRLPGCIHCGLTDHDAAWTFVASSSSDRQSYNKLEYRAKRRRMDVDRPSGGKTRAELESKHGTNWEVAMTRCYQFFLDREAISEEYVPFFTRNQEARRDIFVF